ncbi:MAG: hypothetical protein OMM_07704 [Candidatus Magnetoglobus multicellularis str. Araruama]|uniref:Endonuclease GajA/Old nuclease/RecF-like AAA domain-containing protein n=1 Tax=Candidatus Magnetoglobus multicellularis str. Araruama TaxID=890399 RepID=A0A1V1PBE2_9BACT|nr:MAG: hypothetical protein OMM_07704 [Candidatus Magnetoglobus multicellularis str. Araruama]
MINSFKIKNFKQFNDLFLKHLNLITLIGGKNNTGKTTVLEAFFMFYDSINPEATLRHLSSRGIASIPLNAEFLWSPIFNSYDMDKTIEMEISENDVKEKIQARHTKVLKNLFFLFQQPKAMFRLLKQTNNL